jgi:ketosteroid isomerase-like protein
VLEFLDPEVEWLPPPRSIEPARRGRAAVREMFESWFESWEHLRIEVEDVFRSGDQLVVFPRQSGQGRGSGVEVAVRIAYLWTLHNGKIVRFHLFPERREALRSAGLDVAAGE